MASAEGPVNSEADVHARVVRLERRLDRERRARLEAEQIAEQGMRSLYDANVDLDKRIAERTQELEFALEAAHLANDAKSRFLAQMSHQINTPLNGLMGLLELLATEMRDPQSQEWHSAAMRSAHRLQRITTRLMTYVALEGVDLRAGAPVQPASAVLSAAHDRWHAACLRAGQLLSVDWAAGPEASIHAPVELDLLLDELLSNAVDYAGPGSVVLAGRAIDGVVVIELSDSGAGIDPAVVERSNSFEADPKQDRQADSEIHLGLALVSRITGALAGTWAATSADEAGRSTVTIALPPAELVT